MSIASKYHKELRSKLSGDDKKKLDYINEDRCKAYRKMFYLTKLLNFYTHETTLLENLTVDIIDVLLDESELECPICFDKIKSDKIEINLCKHIICTDCYKKMNPKKCPLCRATWESKYTSIKEQD